LKVNSSGNTGGTLLKSDAFRFVSRVSRPPSSRTKRSPGVLGSEIARAIRRRAASIVTA
jgi:hypothetical protein